MKVHVTPREWNGMEDCSGFHSMAYRVSPKNECVRKSVVALEQVGMKRSIDWRHSAARQLERGCRVLGKDGRRCRDAPRRRRRQNFDVNMGRERRGKPGVAESEGLRERDN